MATLVALSGEIFLKIEIRGLIIINRDAELIYCANDHTSINAIELKKHGIFNIHVEDDGFSTDGTFADGFTCLSQSPCPLSKVTIVLLEHMQHILLLKLEQALSDNYGHLIQIYSSSKFSQTILNSAPLRLHAP